MNTIIRLLHCFYNSHTRTYIFALACLIFAGEASSVYASTHTWSGAVNGLWSNSANWSAGGAPTVGELSPVTYNFPFGATRLNTTNDIGNLSVDTITFNGSNYTLGSQSGFTLTLPTSSSIFSVGTNNVITASMPLVLPVQKTFNVGGSLTIQSVISGVGGLKKVGAGQLTLSGTFANTYADETAVEEGPLVLGKTAGVTAVPGHLRIGHPTGLHPLSTVSLLTANQISNNGNVSINQYGFLDLNDHNEAISVLIFSDGGTVDTGAGILSLEGISVTNPVAAPYIYGKLALNNSPRAVTINTTNGSYLHIFAAINDGNGGSITKAGGGTVGLFTSNAFSGTLSINAGDLIATDSFALGTTNGGTTVADGGSLYVSASVAKEALTLNGTGNGKGAFQNSGVTTWSGPITLASDTLIDSGAGAAKLTLSGLIDGAGGFTKTNTGTLAFVGTDNNTYAGTSIVADGTLQLGKAFIGFGVQSIPGALIVGTTNGAANSEVVQLTFQNQIANSAPVFVNASGKLDLNNFSDTVGFLTMYGGTVDSGTGTLTLNGNIVADAPSSSANINGKLALGGVNRTVLTSHLTALNINAQVSDGGASAGLTLGGTGAVYLQGSNSFTGIVTVNAGALIPYNNAALGSTSAGTVIGPGANLTVFGPFNFGAEPLTLNGNGTGYGALEVYGDCFFSGPVTLPTDTTIAVESQGTGLVFSGSINGPGTLTQTSAGSLTFSGTDDNSHAGTSILLGTLNLAKTGGAIAIPSSLILGTDTNAANSAKIFLQGNNQIANNAPISINTSGDLELGSFSDGIGPLTLAGGEIGSGTGFLTLNADVTANPSIYNSRIFGNLSLGGVTRTLTANGSLQISAHVSDGGGVAGIMKTGSGILSLTSSNTYSGVTTVNNGRLYVSHPQALGSTTAGTVIGTNATIELKNVTITGEPLTLNGMGDIPLGSGAVAPYDTCVWTGPVTLAADTAVGIAPGDQLTFSGPINGPGGLTKLFAGTLVFSGSVANTFTGTTFVKGLLQLNKTAGVNALAGPLIIGDTNSFSQDTVQLLASQQITNSVSVTINPSGSFQMDNLFETIGALNMNGGQVSTMDAGMMTLNGNVTITKPGVNAPLFSGNLSLGGTNRVINVATNAYWNFVASISDGGNNAGFTKTGSGDFFLERASTYGGITTVSAGNLVLFDSGALGSTTGGTIVASGASLWLYDGVNIGNEALTMTGGSAPSLVSGGTNSWAGGATLNGSVIVQTLANDARISLNGVLVGTGGLTTTGIGIVRLGGNTGNLYTGLTQVQQGVLELNKTNAIAVAGPLTVGDGVGFGVDTVRLMQPEQIGNTSAVVVSSSALLNLNSFAETIGSLAGTGNVSLGTAAITLGGNDASTLFNGNITGSGSPFAFQFIKNGAGALTLNGTNSFPGESVVSGGALLVNGLHPGILTVLNNATCGGSGTVGIISNHGFLSPGNSPGILNSADLTCYNGGTFVAELNGTSPGTNYDQLNVTGAVLLDGLLSVALNFNSAVSNQFMIIKNDGNDPVGGNFIGLPEGATLVVSSRQFKISYVGGDGNDVVLTQTSSVTAPSFSSVSYLANGHSLIQGHGFSGVLYRIEASTDLVAWDLMAYAQPDGTGNWAYEDKDASSFPRRFYRLLAP